MEPYGEWKYIDICRGIEDKSENGQSDHEWLILWGIGGEGGDTQSYQSSEVVEDAEENHRKKVE